MEQTPPLLSNLLLSSPPLLFSQLVSCDICSAATWISSCQRRKEGGKRMESNRVTMQGLPKGGVRGTDNQQLLGVQQGETGLCVRVCIHVYMCMSMCERLSEYTVQYVCTCVCAHGSVPGAAIWLLDRALLINREVNCCGGTQAVSNITLGTWRQQTVYMFVYTQTQMCVCLSIKYGPGNPKTFSSTHKWLTTIYYLWHVKRAV